MHRILWTKSDQIWQNGVKGHRQKNIKKKTSLWALCLVPTSSWRPYRLASAPLEPIWLRLSMSMSTTIISSPALLQRRVAKIAQISCSTYIFLIIIEQWQNLESPLYIPLEPPRVEVVDVDLEFPNQVEPRRYPRLRKCVSMERSVPADTRVEIYKQLLVSKYFTWKGSQICGGDHSHTCRG